MNCCNALFDIQRIGLAKLLWRLSREKSERDAQLKHRKNVSIQPLLPDGISHILAATRETPIFKISRKCVLCLGQGDSDADFILFRYSTRVRGMCICA